MSKSIAFALSLGTMAVCRDIDVGNVAGVVQAAKGGLMDDYWRRLFRLLPMPASSAIVWQKQ